MTAMRRSSPPEEAEFRASGTDLSERRRSGVSRGPLDRHSAFAGHEGIAWNAAGAARIGASTTIAAIAGRRPPRGGLSGIAAAARRSGDAADPASRHARRQSRPALALLVFSQSADRLPEEGRRATARRARAIISTASPSISGRASRRIPRPWRRRSWPMTRTVSTNLRPALTIEQLLGDGSNGAADHALNAGEMIEAIELPPPLAGERAAYKRAIGRAYAEWPLVEVVARVVVERRRVPVRAARRPAASRRFRSACMPPRRRRKARPSRPRPLRRRRAPRRRARGPCR